MMQGFFKPRLKPDWEHSHHRN